MKEKRPSSEHNTTRSFASGPSLISTRAYGWPDAAAAISPPSSRYVLERLSEFLTPPMSTYVPTRAQIRRGAYDSMAAHCLAEVHRPHPDMRWAYNSCEGITREHSKSFYFSARFLPPGKREGIMALYAFCRLTDDIVDEADVSVDRATAVKALTEWTSLSRVIREEEEHPVLVAWADTRRRYEIPAELPDEMVEGIRMDLTIDRYETWNDLWVYSYRVASTVGLMSMYITGAESMNAVPYAVQLGVALQLTNILRDVGEDARTGRIYLPQEDIARFGYTEEMLLSGVNNRQFIRLMQFEIARANALYDAAWPGIALLPADSRMSVAAAATVYRGILGKIAAAGYDVFNRRAHLGAAEKMRALAAIWWKSKRLTNSMEKHA